MTPACQDTTATRGMDTASRVSVTSTAARRLSATRGLVSVSVNRSTWVGLVVSALTGSEPSERGAGSAGVTRWGQSVLCVTGTRASVTAGRGWGGWSVTNVSPSTTASLPMDVLSAAVTGMAPSLLNVTSARGSVSVGAG